MHHYINNKIEIHVFFHNLQKNFFVAILNLFQKLVSYSPNPNGQGNLNMKLIQVATP